MIAQIRLLRKLQEIDLRILDLERQRSRCCESSDQLKTKLEGLAAKLQTERAALAEKERRQKKDEDDLAVEKTNLKKWKARLQESKNSRESIALVREIDLQEKSNKHMEDVLLELMQEVETLGKSIKASESEEAEVRGRFVTEEKRSSQEMAALDAHIAEISKERTEYLKQVNPEYLSRYNFIRPRRMGLAVMPVKNGICTGCHMTISPQLLTILVQSNSMQSCPSCQRIIYFHETVYPEEVTIGSTDDGAEK
ncbi:MAG: C4-type zinc ribbon domain-containing protein [Myxococcota bacterium]|jgi:hypothetical protein